eukprot:gene1493-2875_t
MLPISKLHMHTRRICVSIRPKVFPNFNLQNSRWHSDFSSQEENNPPIREKILSYSINHVKECGWSDLALAMGTKDAGLPSTSHTIFGRGAVELVEYFMLKKRQDVMKKLETISSDLPGPERLQLFMEAHLDYLEPYISSWPSALALIADPSPSQIPHSIDNAILLSDDFCKVADLKTSKLDWYMERGALLSIYCSSELYMITDTSDGFTDTKSFLRRSLSCYQMAKSNPTVTATVGAIGDVISRTLRR